MGWVRLHIPVGWAGSQGSDTQHCSLCADCSPGALRGLPSVLCPPPPRLPGSPQRGGSQQPCAADQATKLRKGQSLALDRW